MSYEDLAPYYDKVEMLIGVYGANDGLENTPNSSPGVLLPPPKPRVSDLLVQQARRASSSIPVIAGHRAVLTQRLDHKRLPKLLHPGNAKAQQILAADMQKRAACFWATPCGRGCSIRANYQSTTVHLPPALDTGNLDIVTDAMVRAVTKRKDGKRRRRRLHRPQDRRRTSREGAHRGAGRERARVGAHPAEFRRRQRQRQGRQIHHGHRGRELQRPGARCSRTCRCTTRTAPTAATCTSPWWLYKEQLAGKLGFRARLSHRIRRRPHHARHGHRLAGSSG